MIIAHMNGGLGNQMFQYALGKVLSLEKNTELLLYIKDLEERNIHNGFELNRIFNIDAKIANESDLRKIAGVWYVNRLKNMIMKLIKPKDCFTNKNYVRQSMRNSFCYNSTIFNTANNVFIKGGWFSEKYFSNYRDLILIEYSFKDALSEKNMKIIDKIKNKISVSIHVRRGDFIHYPDIEILDMEYYKKSISIINKKLGDVFYVIFSDDIDWINNYFLSIFKFNNYVVVSHNDKKSSYNDMRLMSLCNHNIIANSTFSWWGAWLNKNHDKIVIAPDKYGLNDTRDTKDMHPFSWIKV